MDTWQAMRAPARRMYPRMVVMRPSKWDAFICKHTQLSDDTTNRASEMMRLCTHVVLKAQSDHGEMADVIRTES